MVEQGSKGMHEGLAETRGQRELPPLITSMPKGWVPVTSWNLRHIFSGDTARAIQEVEKFLDKKISLNQKKGMNFEEARHTVESRWGRVCMYGLTGEGLCIGPDTVDGLLDSGKLSPKIKGPPPRGWLSIEELQKTYAGNYEYMRSMLEAFTAQEERAIIKKVHHSKKEARELVHKGLAGFYLCNEKSVTIPKRYVSSYGIRILEESGKLLRKDMLAPEGWPSTARLEDKYEGTPKHIYDTLAGSIREKIEERIAQGMPKDKAEHEVYTTWGNIFPQLGYPPALHVSPQAEKELVESGKLIAKQRPPRPPSEEWKTAGMLMCDYYGQEQPLYAKIEAFITRKKELLVGGGMQPVVADNMIREKWAGHYSTTLGVSALHLGPEGERELVHSGELVSRGKSPPAPKGWSSAGMLEDRYDCDKSQIHKKILQFIRHKREELEVTGVAANDIDTQISSRWSKFFRDETGHKTLHISPESESAMKEAGMLILPDKTPDSAPEGWLSMKQIDREFAGHYDMLEKKIVNFTAQKADALSREMPREDAEKAAASLWSGTYRYRDSRRSSLFASPETLEEMKEKRLLKPKTHRRKAEGQTHAEYEEQRRREEEGETKGRRWLI